MGQLHNTLVRQAVLTQRDDLRVGYGARVIVHLQRVGEQRLQAVPINGIQSLLQQVPNVVLCCTQPVVQNRAEGSSAVGQPLACETRMPTC